jgi:MFS family permease
MRISSMNGGRKLTFYSHTIALEQLLPIMFATGDSNVSPIYPFKFDGGFGLSAKTIGFILSFQGVLQMIAQIIIFPIVSDRLGPLTTFRIAIFGYPLLYLLIPYIALVPQSLRYLCISVVLLWKVTAQSFSFPSQSIMLANSAPSKRVLGTLNGLAMSSASLARAFGPTFIGYIHAVGRQSGYSIFSWWSCALVAMIGVMVSLQMSVPDRQTAKNEASEEDCDEERGEAQPLLIPRLSDDLEPSICHSNAVDEPIL